MKAIHHTTYPENYTAPEKTGKKADRRINAWYEYISGIKPQNLPRVGGIRFHCEPMERVLDMANEILTLRK